MSVFFVFILPLGSLFSLLCSLHNNFNSTLPRLHRSPFISRNGWIAMPNHAQVYVLDLVRRCMRIGGRLKVTSTMALSAGRAKLEPLVPRRPHSRAWSGRLIERRGANVVRRHRRTRFHFKCSLLDAANEGVLDHGWITWSITVWLFLFSSLLGSAASLSLPGD